MFNAQCSMVKTNRFLSLDVMRGITIVGMILFNTSSGYHYAPLSHASWLGLTLADCAFPFFVFILGMTTWLSLRKYQFAPSGVALRRVAVRALGLILVSWAFDMFADMVFSLSRTGTFDVLGHFSHMRLTGVLVRLGLCYGFCALAALYVRHRYFPHVIVALLVGYFILLLFGDGFDRTPENILGIVDRALIGESHMCNDAGIDPEGILSTIPSVAHAMLGFWVASKVFGAQLSSNSSIVKSSNTNNFQLSGDNVQCSMFNVFYIGSLLLLCGFLLSGVCPISKKIWSPTFVMVLSGFACLSLGVLMELIDRRGHNGVPARFFSVFGANPLFLYLLSESIIWPLELIEVGTGDARTDLWGWFFRSVCVPLFGEQGGDLAFALIIVLLCWLVGYVLWRRKIFIRL